MKRVVMDLPEPLASKAQEAGLFASETMSTMLEDELRRREAGQRLLELMARLHAVPDDPPLTEEQQRQLVNEVIAEVRAQARRDSDARGS